MSKETDEFLSLYRTYEGLLRARGTDYRAVEEKAANGRMTMMRQMRNYLAHSEDPGFIAISPVCLKALEQMIKEETLQGDIVKNHLVTPAKGSVKEGTNLSSAIYKMVMMGKASIPVFGDDKKLKGILLLEKAAYALDKNGNLPLSETVCGAYRKPQHILKPDELTPPDRDDSFYCCTKDGTMASQYMGYLDM